MKLSISNFYFMNRRLHVTGRKSMSRRKRRILNIIL
jgi:hypothetical protein